MIEVILNDECVHCADKECHDGEHFCRQAMKDNSFYKNAKLYKGLEVIQSPTYEELEKENRLLGERCNQLLKDKGDLTDKVSNQAESLRMTMLEEEKKNKQIEELEQENNKLLDVINNQDVKIADLEKQLEQVKVLLNAEREVNEKKEYLQYTEYLMAQLEVAKDLIHQFLIQNPISDWLPKKAEQFIKENGGEK